MGARPVTSSPFNIILRGGYSRVQCDLPVALLGDWDPIQAPGEVSVVIASKNQLAPCTPAGRGGQIVKEGPPESLRDELQLGVCLLVWSLTPSP